MMKDYSGLTFDTL